MTEFDLLKGRVLEMGGEGNNADIAEAMKLADWFSANGESRLEATAIDVAYGLQPDDELIRSWREELLESLAVSEKGIDYCYVPAGTFLMGSNDGEPDERPVHPVFIDEYWVAKVPISWTLYAKLMDWNPPPRAFPDIEFGEENRMQGFHLNEMNKIRMIYCETETTQGGDWHSHSPPDDKWISGGKETTARQVFGAPPRENGEAPYTYDVKPMVAVAVREIEELCERISDPQVTYQLPNEAQWEKAARGGLIGKPYSWGDAPPDESRADYGHFGKWRIHDPLTYPPNGYGLHGMCGTVWEWTRDTYDAMAYRQAAIPDEIAGAEKAHVLRGGSWLDCEDAITVSFRMSRSSGHWKDAKWGGHNSPNIGFRLVREEVKQL